jgi:transcriptional/translational regulatory protein YebC/TACO1
MGAASWAFEKKDSEWIAQTTIPVSDEDQQKLEQLVEALEENEDVQQVYTNAA